jgi:hypothetical protein
MEAELLDYTHPELDREVESIGGRYVLTKEARLPYLTGYAVFDTTCCGEGGCGYALVPGFIRDWKYRMDEGGRPVSRTEPIRDGSLREEVRRLIEGREMVNQVNFD